MVGVAQPIACCGKCSREGRGGEIADRRMRALLVVGGSPAGQGGAGVIEIVEDRLVEQFVAHAAVEGFANPILHWLTRRNEMPSDPTALSPSQHSVGGELGSVIGDDQIGFAAPRDDRVEFSRHPATRERGVGDRRQAFLGHVVDHVEDAEAPTVRELVVDEVDRPAGVRLRLDEDRRPRARRSLAALALADSETLLAVKPLRLLAIQTIALGAQKDVQPAITEPALLGRQLPQAAAQGVVPRSTRSIADGLAIGLDQAARPALAHLVGGYETGDSLALGGGRQNFFVMRSFSAALSSIASARSRFSLAFSSSSCLSRLASDTSIPPNLAFQP